MSLCFIALGNCFLHDAVEILSEPTETFTIHSTPRQGVHTINPFIRNKEINRIVTFFLLQNTEENTSFCLLSLACFLYTCLGRDSSTILTKTKLSYFSWCSKAEDAVVIHCLASCNQQQMMGSRLEHHCLKNIKSSTFFLTKRYQQTFCL